MKISHETPISLLSESLKFNDYQYCLVHLLEEQPKYLDHFKKCRRDNVHILLDNSIFELGEAFDTDKYFDWVMSICPDEYIMPDVLEDAVGTINNATEWMKEKHPIAKAKGMKVIGVVQGKSYQEIAECYRDLVKLGVDKIAISFNYSWYELDFPSTNKLISWCYGRYFMLNMLFQDQVIDTSIPHHLLGCSLPQEFGLYPKEWGWLDSLDTSNPIVAGIKDVEYDRNLIEKPSIKLFELIEEQLSTEVKDRCIENTEIFKEIVNSRP